MRYVDWMENILSGYKWYLEEKVLEESSQLSSTRDVFRARWNQMDQYCLNLWENPNETALFSAVIGELGNNCFDHNLGQWRDIAGCWFQYKIQKKSAWAIVADRGQGILSSLKHVLPTLQNDQDALNTAFEQKISGRSPEHRGNGLKFVKNVIHNDEKRGLFYVSGKGKVLLGKLSPKLQDIFMGVEVKKQGRGTFSMAAWGNFA